MRAIPPRVSAVASALVLTVLAGCSGGAGSAAVSVRDPAVGAVPTGSAALYMTVENHSADDAILGASCECATEASLHVVEDRGGILMMVPTDRIELPADSSTDLDPVGAHIMLEGLEEPLEAGGSIQVTIRFDRAPQRTVEVPVHELADLAERVESQP